MPSLYDDDDELMQLLDSGGEAPTIDLNTLSAPSIAAGGGTVDADELDALMQDAIASKSAKSGGPSMEIGEIQMAGSAPREPAAEENAPSADWAPAGEETGLESLLESSSAPVPAPKDMAEQVMSESPEGNQQPFGVRDERDDLMAARDRVRGLYGEQAPEESGPGRYEQEYLASSRRPTEQDMKKAWVIHTLFGDKGDNFKAMEMVRGMQKEFDQGLLAARAADKETGTKNRRVGQGAAELAVLAGISPESAVNMTERDLQALQSLGGLGTRIRGQDTQVLNKNVGETGDVWKTLTTEEGKDERAQLSADTQLKTAALRKRSAGGGGGGQNTGLMSYYLQESRNVPQDVADAAAAGTLDLATLSPEMRSKVQLGMTGFKSLDGKTRQQLVRGLESRVGSEQDKVALSAQVKQADPVQRLKIKDEVTRTGMPLKSAVSGWNSLSPKAKDLIVKIGLEGSVSQLRDAGLSPQEQAAAGAIISQVNQYIKAVSGAAVSGGEWARMGAELGISGNGVAPFKSSATLGSWLQRAMGMYKAHVNNVTSEYPDLFTKGAR